MLLFLSSSRFSFHIVFLLHSLYFHRYRVPLKCTDEVNEILRRKKKQKKLQKPTKTHSYPFAGSDGNHGVLHVLHLRQHFLLHTRQ